MTRVGFEPTLFRTANFLESKQGPEHSALDHSAILPSHVLHCTQLKLTCKDQHRPTECSEHSVACSRLIQGFANCSDIYQSYSRWRTISTVGLTLFSIGELIANPIFSLNDHFSFRADPVSCSKPGRISPWMVELTT
jgi:hypothetical protein